MIAIPILTQESNKKHLKHDKHTKLHHWFSFGTCGRAQNAVTVKVKKF